MVFKMHLTHQSFLPTLAVLEFDFGAHIMEKVAVLAQVPLQI